MSKYKNILEKFTFPIGLKKFLWFKKKIENIVPWTYFISDLNGEKIAKNLLPKEGAKNKFKRL